jgi:hypothetical protein
MRKKFGSISQKSIFVCDYVNNHWIVIHMFDEDDFEIGDDDKWADELEEEVEEWGDEWEEDEDDW